MPSHAIPPGRAQRRVARRRLLSRFRQGLPWVLVWTTIFQVAGMPTSRGGSAMSQALDVIRVEGTGALVVGLAVAVVVVLHLRMNAWRAHDAAAPRPRWHYLLASFGWLAVAACFILVAFRTGTGLPARISAALGWWSGLYGLVLIGRAATWGRVRALMWWGSSSTASQ